MQLDDELARALLERVAQRDEAAFEQLYRALSRPVYAFALQALRDPAAAAEVVTETLYQLWRTPSGFRGEGKVSTWVLGIARHKVVDRIRAQPPPHEDVDELAEALESEEPDAFQSLAVQQRREGVLNCMEKLQDTQRECLYLVYYEGLSLAEVSVVLSIPENTVKTRLFHARAKIKQCLKLLLQREGSDERS